MADAARPTPEGTIVPARHPWTLPRLAELPKLTALTLASAIGGTGGTGGSGSTVFGLLLAVGFLVSACSSDGAVGPGTPPIAPALASISCVGDVATLRISCAAPAAVTGQEIIGGQGKRVVLRATDPHYTDAGLGVGDFTFKVTVQNVSTQILGFGSTGVHAFFEAAPLPDVGSITVKDNLVGTFTAGGQAYYDYPGSLGPWATSAEVQWRFHMVGGVSTFTFNVLVAADLYDKGGVLRWEPVLGHDQRKYQDVAVSSPTDWMAVGDAGITRHFDGVQWTTLPGIVSEAITSVAAVSPGRYYAATAGGGILYFDGKVWNEVYRRGDYGPLYAIHVVSNTNIIAVGENGRISHLAGGTWSDVDVTTGGGAALTAVSANASGTNVSAVNGGFGVLEVWTSTAGGPFVLDPRFAAAYGGTNLATDIVYDPAGNVLLAYEEFVGSPSNGVVRSSTGDVIISETDIWPRVLVPLGANEVAVGFRYIPDGLNYILDVDYTGLPAVYLNQSDPLGFDFTQMALADLGTFQFAVAGADQHLYHWTGGGGYWADLQGPSTMVDPDLWGVGDSVWLLDGIGNFYKVVNGVSTQGPGLPGLHEISGVSSTSFFAATDADIYHSNGTSAWSLVAHPFVATPIKHLWVSPSGQTILASTVGTEVYTSFASGLLEYVVDIGATVTGMWGCDDVDIWITTDNGNIHRWASGGIDPGPYITSPTPLRAITGSSCSDIWAVGDGGAAYYYDGSTWFDFSAPGGPTSFAAAIRDPGQVLVAGAFGVGGLFTYFGAFQNEDIPTQSDNVTSLWRTSHGQVYAAGHDLFLRGLR
jgi:hypothetical protein